MIIPDQNKLIVIIFKTIITGIIDIIVIILKIIIILINDPNPRVTQSQLAERLLASLSGDLSFLFQPAGELVAIVCFWDQLNIGKNASITKWAEMILNNPSLQRNCFQLGQKSGDLSFEFQTVGSLVVNPKPVAAQKFSNGSFDSISTSHGKIVIQYSHQHLCILGVRCAACV